MPTQPALFAAPDLAPSRPFRRGDRVQVRFPNGQQPAVVQRSWPRAVPPTLALRPLLEDGTPDPDSVLVLPAAWCKQISEKKNPNDTH